MLKCDEDFKMKVGVSVIIPTYNRKESLEKCLDSLLRQSYREKYEVIVVDDGSNDSTSEVVKKLQRKHKNLRYFYQENKGPAVARNLGIKKSKGRIIAFTDDDCVVDKNWLKNIVKCHNLHPEYAIIGGNIYNRENSLTAKVEYFNWGYAMITQNTKKRFIKRIKVYLHPYSIGKSRLLSWLGASNVSFKREVFKKVGLFDETFKWAALEDVELCWRAYKKNCHVYYQPRIAVSHYKKHSLKSFLVQSFKRGIDVCKIKSKHNDFYMLGLPHNPLGALFFISFPFFMFIFKILQIRRFKDFITYPPYLFLNGAAYWTGIIYGMVKNRRMWSLSDEKQIAVK